MLSHLVFDLGGVIVELGGSPVKNEWIAGTLSQDEAWQKWLTSTAPREFESGKTSPTAFAEQLVAELKLSISPAEFLDHFLHWPIGPFPGAVEMLHSLGSRYRTALFSNSNELHWNRKMGEMQLDRVFHERFASHLMGMVKPDAEAFEYVISALGVEPGSILFLDDNQINVEAAIEAGMRAQRVQGLSAVQACLREHDIDW